MLKKLFVTFLICFVPSFSLLYYFSGSILNKRIESPIKVISSKNDQEPLEIKKGNQQLKLYNRHKVKGGKYYSYEGKRKVFEILFEEMIPSKKDKILLKNPLCIYFPEEKRKDIEMPSVYHITAKRGELFLKDKEEFSFLHLTEKVKIKGYKKEGDKIPLSRLHTNKANIDLIEQIIKTSEKVYFIQDNTLSLEGTGITGNIKLQKFKIKKNTKLKIYEKALSLKEKNKKQKLFEGELESISKGALDLEISKDNQKINITQNEDVIISNNSGKLKCDHIEFMLLKAEKDFDLKNVYANKKVTYEDGQGKIKNKIECEEFNFDSKDENSSMVAFKGKPEFTIHDLSNFTIFTEEIKKKIEKQKNKRKFRTLYAKADKEIHIFRYRDKEKWIEDIFLYKNVRMLQTSDKIKIMQLFCDEKAEIKLQAIENKRKPVYLKAFKNVKLDHEKVSAKGEYFEWQHISKEIQKLKITANIPDKKSYKNKQIGSQPFLLIKDLEFSQSIAPMDSNLLEDIKKDKAKKKNTKEKKKKKKSLEDIEVRASKEIKILVEDKKKYKRLVKCKAYDNVRLTRYDKTSGRKRVGSFRFDTLQVKLKEKEEQQKKQKEKKDSLENKNLEIVYLLGDGNVLFSSEDGIGGGDKFLITQEGKKNVVHLLGNAWTKSKEGELTADKFIYNTNTEKFYASGTPVNLYSKDYCSRSDTLEYFKNTEKLRLVGNPAEVWQTAKTKALSKNKMSAKEIDLFKETGKVLARGNVEIFAKPDESKISKKKQNNKKKPLGNLKNISLDKNESLHIKSDNLRVIYDKEKEEVKFLTANGNIFFENIVKDKSIPYKRLSGDWLVYRDKKAVIYGKPNKIIHDKQEIFSDKITFLENEKIVIFQGPAEVFLPEINKKKSNKINIIKKDSKKKQSLRIKSEGPIMFYQDENLITFNDNVVCESENGKLFCEILKIFIDKEDIKIIIAHKDVFLVSDKFEARANLIRWDAKKETVNMIGNPNVEIKSEKSTISLPKLEYNTKLEKFNSRGQGIILEHSIDSSKALKMFDFLYKKK